MEFTEEGSMGSEKRTEISVVSETWTTEQLTWRPPTPLLQPKEHVSTNIGPSLPPPSPLPPPPQEARRELARSR